MYRLVLGIITIGVLQFTLLMYLQTEKFVEKTVAEVQPPAMYLYPAIESQQSDKAQSISEPVGLNRAGAGNPRRESRAQNRPSKQEVPRAERPGKAIATRPSNFNAVVISYNVPAEKPACSSPEGEKPKRHQNSQLAAASVPRWKVIKTDLLSF